jgi:putative endonuclease
VRRRIKYTIKRLFRRKWRNLHSFHFTVLINHLELSTVSNNTYYIYIITNASRRSLYIAVTNSLKTRLEQHYLSRGSSSTWAGRYYCYFLVYYEEFVYINNAIRREKQLKGWSRKKKEILISRKNPEWRFLNSDFDP